MAQTTTGVYQLPNGNWGYRFTKTVDGKRTNHKSVRDANGQPMKTQRAAIRARDLAIMQFEASIHDRVEMPRVTFEFVYNEYCENGRVGKAYSTIRKQDSLWNNHLRDKFGDYFIDEISVAKVNDYLATLYYVEGRAYRYVEGFLKMFYLIFGQAYSRNYIGTETYSKLCVNKDVRIRMPKMKTDEETDVKVFSCEEIELLDGYFKGTNAETAYYLGCYCGLRISECYGLKWSEVDLIKGTININRQMQYQDGLIKLVPLKTRNAKRTIYLSERLTEYFKQLYREKESVSDSMRKLRRQNQTYIEDIDGKEISSLELVNTSLNGKIQTINSMKYHSKKIKERLKMDFRYHYLRHTYGTRLAELNTPMHILCNQMGHASGKVTEKYYLGVSKTGIEILTENLNRL